MGEETPAQRNTGNVGPDFLCIGTQKAGTGWLYEQLRSHPDFWMPPLKELHYFDRLKMGTSNALQRTLPFARKTEQRMNMARQNVRDDRDVRFLNIIEKLSAQDDVDLEKYSRLFEPKGSLISGDITPGYSTLRDDVIAKITGYFSNLKVILVARDPVERAWSQLSMYVRRKLIEPFDANDADTVTQHLCRPEIAARSYPSEIVARWRQHLRPDVFKIYFFDELKRSPAELRRAVIQFFGGDPDKPSANLAPDHNPKAGKEKLPLNDDMRLVLARFFEKELKACAKELGGAAAEWPARYGF